MIFTLFVLAVMAFNLNKDFSRDPQDHRTAKAVHAAVLTMLLAYFSTSVRQAGWVIGHFSRTIDKFYVSIAAIPAGLHLALFFVQLAVAVAIYFLAWGIITRKANVLSYLLKILPVAVLTETFSFYRSWTDYGKDFSYSAAATIVAFVAMGSLAALVVFLYNQKFMKLFFELQPTPKQ